ncbi:MULTISPECIES: hypothetical protein [Catenibacterium]|uniref:hypothetical protein n=1 Tax=Catenibacterium TaxID=135858 RepID=UPI0018A8C1A1|nr:hypothetical protein [Catenibacterium mitsuokai]
MNLNKKLLGFFYIGNFSSLSAFSKLVLSFDMLAGRLEIFPMLMIFSKTLWKR